MEGRRIGVYPGSFNPPTVAHLAILSAARAQLDLRRVDLVISRDTLGKGLLGTAQIKARLALMWEAVGHLGWVECKATDHRLIADIAKGYDAVICGADKWNQMLDPAWYGGSAERASAALAGLPPVAVAPRAGSPLRSPRDLAPSLDLVILDLDPALAEVSSSAVRSGRSEWAAMPQPEA